MLYVKNINNITSNDVIDFCSRNIKENEILEYKSEITGEIDKVVTAMANTYGGIVLIGISEEDGKPKPPFIGIGYERGMEERITQILISNTFPPLLPEIRVCQAEDKEHAFLIIRTAESDSSPHYIKQKTKAYIRTGNVTTPERIADADEIEWLRNRRQKAISFREYLLKNADEHYATISRSTSTMIAQSSEMALSICPLFPSKTIVAPKNIDDLLFKINAKSRITYGQLKHYSSLPIQYGLATFLAYKSTLDYLEINQFGLIAKSRILEWEKQKLTPEQAEDGEKPKEQIVNYEEIFLGVFAFFEFVNLFYETIGYHGYCKFQLTIKNSLNVSLNPFVGGIGILSNGVSIAADYLLPENLQTISVPAFRNQDVRLSLLIEVSEDIARAFGSEIDPTMPNVEFLKKFALSKTGR
jgi:hypothetical protein